MCLAAAAALVASPVLSGARLFALGSGTESVSSSDALAVAMVTITGVVLALLLTEALRLGRLGQQISGREAEL